MSKTYTNHSVRTTAITTLDNACVEARHIMKTSNHKSESSITHNRVSNEKRSMFDTLSAGKEAKSTGWSSTGSKSPMQLKEIIFIQLLKIERK